MSLNKRDFLKRCENAWNAGLITPETLRLLNRWLDMVLRLEGGQMGIFVAYLNTERFRTQNFGPGRTLANDADGYKLIQFAAILNHHCQQCAEDPQAWWTRSAFCPHGVEEQR